MVRVCKVTAYKAWKLYGVKSGTLSAHLSGKVKLEVKGRPPRFTVEEEKTLLDVLIQLAVWCFQQSNGEVIEMTRQFAIKLNKKATNNENDERLYIPCYHSTTTPKNKFTTNSQFASNSELASNSQFASNSNSQFFSKVLGDVIVSTQARKTKPDKRKRIVGNAGQCLTNQEAIDIMEEQEQIKRKKPSNKVFDKKTREENKLKQKQETKNKRKLRLVKKKTLKGRSVCVEKNK